MKRRRFLTRLGTLAAGMLAARRALAQLGESAPAPPYSADSLRAAPPDERPAPADTSAAGAEPAVTIAAGGDTTLGYNLQDHFDRMLAEGATRESLWPLYFAGIREPLAAADLALVNLECPFTERGTKLPKNFNFRARLELVEILKQGSVDVVTLANNHLMDWGPEGIEDTRATLDRAGIGHFGAGATLAEARTPWIVERNGMKLGFLGYYFQDRRDMIEPRAIYARERKPGVAGCYTSLPCMLDMVREDVSKLVPAVDAALVYFHWGWEGRYVVRDYQVRLAHLCVDLGCRAVLGCHPHRLQGVEVYRGAPILYSLGNFVYGGNKDPQDKLSAIARLRITKRGATADLLPIQITRWPEAPFQPFVLEPPLGDYALRRIAELSEPFPETLPQLAAARAEAAR